MKEVKESAAQRVERIKKQKDGLDVLKDIQKYSKNGGIVTNSEDIDRFKWYGLYTQNRNLQNEDDETLYFMLRVKLLNGEMNLAQIQTLANISKEFAKGTADFTTRQDLQFHFIKVVDLPTIFDRLESVGLSTAFAAGDVPRNVVTCPVNGIEHNAIYDASKIVQEVNNYFSENKELSNLPRKYKVAISGCSKHCISHEINDLSFSATKFEDRVLFSVHIGGGLASNKQIAKLLGYVEENQVLAVTKAVSEIYRDFGFRDNRKKARLGHLLSEWGVEKFLEALHQKLDFKLIVMSEQNFTPFAQREHFGVHKSKTLGKSYIGCQISCGNIGGDGLLSLHNILKKYGANSIKATISQNFIIQDVPNENINNLVQELENINIYANPSPFRIRACTGLNFCKFAISETKDLAKSIVEHLNKKFPNFKEITTISVNGCPNSCSHPHIVDIGLVGTKLKEDGETVSGFELLLGGNLQGDKSKFAIKSKIKFSPSKAPQILEELILDFKNSNEVSFNQFLLKKVDDK